MAHFRAGAAALSDHLDHIKPETNPRASQAPDIPHCRTGCRMTLLSIDRREWASEVLIPPRLDLHENERLAVSRHEVNLVSAADPNAAPEDTVPVSPQEPFGLALAPFTRVLRLCAHQRFNPDFAVQDWS